MIKFLLSWPRSCTSFVRIWQITGLCPLRPVRPLQLAFAHAVLQLQPELQEWPLPVVAVRRSMN